MIVRTYVVGILCRNGGNIKYCNDVIRSGSACDLDFVTFCGPSLLFIQIRVRCKLMESTTEITFRMVFVVFGLIGQC